MRRYEETHPWITFRVVLDNAGHKLWVLLGKAAATCECILGTPLLPPVRDKLLLVYLAKGVNATTAIEGNTLTEEEVLRQIQGELTLPPSKEYLGKEIDNVLKAYNQIGDGVFKGQSAELCVEELKRYNAMILDGLPLPEEVIPGEIRTHDVRVGGYPGAPWEDCPYLLDRLCQFINREISLLQEDPRVIGVLKAIIAHLYMAWIHPFGDGNGRTARLLEFKILLEAGIPATAAHLLSNHYNQTRTRYYLELERSHRSGGDVSAFIEYALQGFVDQLAEQMGEIKRQQMSVHFINFVHKMFGDDQPTDIRKRHLVLDLAQKDQPVPMKEMRHVSPRIAESYASKTDRTVKRDVEELIEYKLIRREKAGYTANFSLIESFLPRSARG